VGIGDQLSAGDAVARIDSSLIAQQLEMANASLRSAQAEERAADVPLKEARARQTRREALWESGVISREDLATAEAQTEKAITDLEVARAHVAEQVLLVKHMKATLENTTITASFEGTVAATYLDAGAKLIADAHIDFFHRAFGARDDVSRLVRKDYTYISVMRLRL